VVQERDEAKHCLKLKGPNTKIWEHNRLGDCLLAFDDAAKEDDLNSL
jgi:hypothetical protein